MSKQQISESYRRIWQAWECPVISILEITAIDSKTKPLCSITHTNRILMGCLR